jgi:hypothetical protein
MDGLDSASTEMPKRPLPPFLTS